MMMGVLIHLFYLAFLIATFILAVLWRPNYLVSLAIAFLIGVLWVVFDRWVSQGPKRRLAPTIIPACLILLTLIPRLLWIKAVHVIQVSDYLTYDRIARGLVKGEIISPEYIALFPHVLSYSAVLSFFYRIFGQDVIVAQILNILFACGTTLLVYCLSRRITSERYGVIAGVICALWPSQIFFTNLVSTEAAFTFILLLNVVFFWFILHMSNKRKVNLAFFGLGITMGVMNAIRPLGLVMIIAIAFYYLLYVDTKLKQARDLLYKGLSLLMLCISYLLSVTCIREAISFAIQREVGASFMGYSMLVGTNYSSGGGWNKQDSLLLSETYNNGKTSPDEANRILFHKAVARIAANPMQFIRLQITKNQRAWQTDDFGVAWNIRTMDKDNPGLINVKREREWLVPLSNLYYYTVMIFNILYAILCVKNKNSGFNLFFVLLILGSAAILALTEAQNRYHYHVIPLMVVMACSGLNLLVREKRIAGHRAPAA